MIKSTDKVLPILFWIGFIVLGIVTNLNGQNEPHSKRSVQIAETNDAAYNPAE